jgi:hypothetical protein
MAGIAHPAVIISEVLVNPPGPDNGLEFFELLSNSGGAEALSGLTLLVIEGDSASNPGEIDQVINLNAFSTGANGLFLWADSVLAPDFTADAATAVHIADFFPDLENGSSTFILVRGFTGLIGTDLDVNDDGVIDTRPWASIEDAFSFSDFDSGDRVYAGLLGYGELPNVGFVPDGRSVVPGGDVLYFDAIVTTGGFIAPDTFQLVNQFGTPVSAPVGFSITPGAPNIVPEPGAAALLAFSAGILASTRRRKRADW